MANESNGGEIPYIPLSQKFTDRQTISSTPGKQLIGAYDHHYHSAGLSIGIVASTIRLIT